MASLKQKPIDESVKLELKFTKQLVHLLERLHEVGTERDRAGNRSGVLSFLGLPRGSRRFSGVSPAQ